MITLNVKECRTSVLNAHPGSGGNAIRIAISDMKGIYLCVRQERAAATSSIAAHRLAQRTSLTMLAIPLRVVSSLHSVRSIK